MLPVQKESKPSVLLKALQDITVICTSPQCLLIMCDVL